ncbi:MULTISPECIES: hypothetical protein [Novosphingobium]|uniref:hypothetical protein n=1 Tax=Novosphingobium TaxID=165696 RepID=UPI001CD4B188|nr:hypothetical protein [Novosphingobium percolationis]MCH7629917.1 hypothetical protein [Pseudomonadota bacterium]
MSSAGTTLLGLLLGLIVAPAAGLARSADPVWQLPAGGDSTEAAPPSAEAVAQALLTPTKRERCAPGSGDAIVVCGTNAENARQKLDSVAPLGAGKTADGAPRAPNVSGLRDCSRGCIGFGTAPAPMYYFDIKALPPAPAGSDADRIARGEIKAP